MSIDYSYAQKQADFAIKRFGMRAVLRRASGDRWVTVGNVGFSPADNIGKIRDPSDRKYIVSALGLLIPPVKGVDRLITFVQPLGTTPVQDANLEIVETPGRVAPGGVTLFWRLVVRR